jgi:hypothetical protein
LETEFIDQLIEHKSLGFVFNIYEYARKRVNDVYGKARRAAFSDGDLTKLEVLHPGDQGTDWDARRKLKPTNVERHLAGILVFKVPSDEHGKTWAMNLVCSWDDIPIGEATLVKEFSDHSVYSLTHAASERFTSARRIYA